MTTTDDLNKLLDPAHAQPYSSFGGGGYAGGFTGYGSGYGSDYGDGSDGRGYGDSCGGGLRSKGNGSNTVPELITEDILP